MKNKPFAESCVQNREPIFSVIAPLLRDCRRLLEIGSGTGQHAVYFAAGLPHLEWQTSDRAASHAGIRAWIEDAGLENVLPPLMLDVSADDWPQTCFDAVFTANTVHIMSHDEVEAMLAGVGRCLDDNGSLLIYGPFNYHGEYTSDSNARFDIWLKQRDPRSGIKDFEWLVDQAAGHGMMLENDYAMPANNRILHFRRSSMR